MEPWKPNDRRRTRVLKGLADSIASNLATSRGSSTA
jgi:hypothetical protein